MHEPVPTRRPVLPPDTLVGRDVELAALGALVDDPAVRVLTLTGPGGVGKTRLALELGSALTAEGRPAPTVVDLAHLTDPGLVLPALARALGLRDEGDAPLDARLGAELIGAPRLLILDNVEQVLAAGPALAGLAATVPGLTLLITSRARLGVHGEHEFPVPPLATLGWSRYDPPPSVDVVADNDACALFLTRARAANPDLTLSDANAAAVAEICRRLDGLPLAIELAAARARVLSPQAMLARLTGRLSLLSAGPTDLPDRHRTLAAAVAWSHDLLPPDVQALFRRLAVFVGPFTAAAAEAVTSRSVDATPDAASTVDGLTALLDASLLQRSTGADGEVRFRLLETVRAFARERLAESGEADAAAERHALWHCDLVLASEKDVYRGDLAPWFAAFAEVQDELRAAVDWALAAERGSLALRLLVGPVWYFWSMRGWATRERPRLDRALALVDRPPDPADPPDLAETKLLANALINVGLSCLQSGDYPTARARFERALAVLRPLGPDGYLGVSLALTNLAILDNDQGDYAAAEAKLEEALAVRRVVGDPSAVGRTLSNLANVAHLRGRPDAAVALSDEALPLLRAAGDRRTMGSCLTTLGEAEAARGDHPRALAYLDQALGLLRHAGDVMGEGFALVHLAVSALAVGDRRRAAAALAEALSQQRETRTPTIVADALDAVAAVALDAGRPEQAPRLQAAAEAVRQSAATVPTPLARRRRERTAAAARAALARPALDAATIAGRALTPTDAIEAALALLESLSTAAGEIVPFPTHRAAAAATTGPCPTPATDEPSAPRSPSSSPSPATPGAALSARQREVLALLVEGLTDPEIAERLGVGVRTVESHVAAILNKLGLHARTAAVAYAVRHSLA